MSSNSLIFSIKVKRASGGIPLGSYPNALCLTYDTDEEDYSSLTGYEQELAQTEAGKRLCRLTKAEMLSRIGWAMGITLAFFDLRQSYDYLKAMFDILRDENTSLLDTIKEIESLYDEMNSGDYTSQRIAEKKFDRLLETLPERAWLE